MENDNISKHSGLMSAVRHYSNPQICIDEVAAVKWPSAQAVCPRCSSKNAAYLSTRLLWKCRDCKKQFSVKIGTIFEDSAIGLDKWLCAMWMLANCKNGVSSYEVGRALEVTQKTAWFMLRRIRYAMHYGTINKMSGTSEADETFIGGAARLMQQTQAQRESARSRPWRKRDRVRIPGALNRESSRSPRRDSAQRANSPASCARTFGKVPRL